ncbi:MAG: flagellar biosynthesis anti-sigma factor FlgM [Bacillota bacterium]|nr:flagellar biosynthesis anti-sigma factor FlgM [Bacillota bacterium]
MKINWSNMEKILGVYRKQGVQGKKTERAAGAEGVRKADRIELSAEAKDLQLALRALSQVPEIREGKVADIKNRIRAGEYNVSAEEVADKIIDGLFIDKKV